MTGVQTCALPIYIETVSFNWEKGNISDLKLEDEIDFSISSLNTGIMNKENLLKMNEITKKVCCYVTTAAVFLAAILVIRATSSKTAVISSKRVKSEAKAMIYFRKRVRLKKPAIITEKV